MATIHMLQREVLNPTEERLLAIVHVKKAYKKKKSSFLCLVVSCVTPITVSIYQVRASHEIIHYYINEGAIVIYILIVYIRYFVVR